MNHLQYFFRKLTYGQRQLAGGIILSLVAVYLTYKLLYDSSWLAFPSMVILGLIWLICFIRSIKRDWITFGIFHKARNLWPSLVYGSWPLTVYCFARLFIQLEDKRAHVPSIFYAYHDNGALAKSRIDFRTDSTFSFSNGLFGPDYGTFSISSTGLIRLKRNFDDRALKSNYLKILEVRPNVMLLVETDVDGIPLPDGFEFVPQGNFPGR